MPYKTWAVGEEVLAADFQTYLQNQTVPQFPNEATRDSQWSAPPQGALCVTTDTNTLWRRSATAWARATPGVLGLASVTSVQTGISTTAVDVTGLSVTVTVAAGRWIEVGARVQWQSTAGFTADAQVITTLLDGAVTIQRHQSSYTGGGGVRRDTHGPTILLAGPSAGSHTYKVQMVTAGTGATISTEHGGSFPGQVWVKDLGAL